MMAVAERFEDVRIPSKAAKWQGRSGRFYALTALPIDRFTLAGPELFLLARGGDVLWVGSEAEVIGDAVVRAAFRAALRVANAAFSIAQPETEIDRLTMAWDLEDAQPVTGLRLA